MLHNLRPWQSVIVNENSTSARAGQAGHVVIVPAPDSDDVTVHFDQDNGEESIAAADLTRLGVV